MGISRLKVEFTVSAIDDSGEIVEELSSTTFQEDFNSSLDAYQAIDRMSSVVDAD